MRAHVATLVAAAFSMACGGAGFQSYEPVHTKTKLEPDQLLTAAQRSIEKLGYQMVGLDRATHTVRTREKEVGYSNVPRLSYRYSFRIETKGGVLKIDAACEQNTSMNRTEFSDCGDERPQHVISPSFTVTGGSATPHECSSPLKILNRGRMVDILPGSGDRKPTTPRIGCAAYDAAPNWDRQSGRPTLNRNSGWRECSRCSGRDGANGQEIGDFRRSSATFADRRANAS
jgi:hypothetical protein